MKRFEIVYGDGTIQMGFSADDWLAAPAGPDFADDGIIFVIVEHDDGSIERFKGISTYTLEGIDKPGAWAQPEVYERIKASLIVLSELCGNPTPAVRRQREWPHGYKRQLVVEVLKA